MNSKFQSTAFIFYGDGIGRTKGVVVSFCRILNLFIMRVGNNITITTTFFVTSSRNSSICLLDKWLTLIQNAKKEWNK